MTMKTLKDMTNHELGKMGLHAQKVVDRMTKDLLRYAGTQVYQDKKDALKAINDEIRRRLMVKPL